MHQILSGKNTLKLLKLLGLEKEYIYPCIYIFRNTVLAIDYYMYSSAYEENFREPVDITENQLDKAITIYELLEDSKLALESLRE